MNRKLNFVDGAYPPRHTPQPKPNTKPVIVQPPAPPVVQSTITDEQIQQIANTVIAALADKLGSATIAISAPQLPEQLPIQIDETVIDVSSITDADKFSAPVTIQIEEEEYDFDRAQQDKLKQLLRRK